MVVEFALNLGVEAKKRHISSFHGIETQLCITAPPIVKSPAVEESERPPSDGGGARGGPQPVERPVTTSRRSERGGGSLNNLPQVMQFLPTKLASDKVVH